MDTNTNTDTSNNTRQRSDEKRPYAVVLYGATSFVGQITAHYLTEFYLILKTKMAPMSRGRLLGVMKQN